MPILMFMPAVSATNFPALNMYLTMPLPEPQAKVLHGFLWKSELLNFMIFLTPTLIQRCTESCPKVGNCCILNGKICKQLSNLSLNIANRTH